MLLLIWITEVCTGNNFKAPNDTQNERAFVVMIDFGALRIHYKNKAPENGKIT